MTSVPRRIALTVAVVETALGAVAIVWELAQRIRDNHHRKD